MEFHEATMIQEILMALLGKTAELSIDVVLDKIREQYNPLAKKAAETTAKQLSEKYGSEFSEIWGSRNFIESLPSLGNPELTQALSCIKEGEWEVNQAKIANSLGKQLAETMPQLSRFALELVGVFLENFKVILKAEDPAALTKRIYNTVEATQAKVDDTHRMMQQFIADWPNAQAQLQSLSDLQPEVASLRNQLHEVKRQVCEGELKRADLLIASFKFDQAKEVLLPIEATAILINDAKLLGRLYNTLAQTELWQGTRSTAEGESYLQKAAIHIPDSSILKTNLAVYYSNVQQFEKAASCLSSIPPAQQTFANYYNVKGLLAVHDKRNEEAKESFLKVIELDSSFWEGQGNLGRLFIELGQMDEAEKVFVALHANNPKHISPYIGLGNISFDRANGSTPESAEDQSNLEKAHGWYVDGIKTLQVLGVEERYVKEDLGVLLGNLGGVEAALGDFEKAEEHLKKSIELLPDHTNGHFNLAQLYHRLDRYDEALAEFETVYDLGRRDEMTLVNIGGMSLALYNQKKDPTHLLRAEEVFNDVCNETKCSLALENLCSVYFLTDREDRIREVCEEILATNPRCEHALSPLALYYTRRGDAEKARQLRSELLNINPSSFDGNFDLAVNYIRESDWDKAIGPLMKCVKPSGLTSSLLIQAYLMLAECHKRLGDPVSALDTVLAASSRFPNNPSLKQAFSHFAKATPEPRARLFVPAPRPR